MVHSSEVANLDSSFEAVLRCVCYWHCLHSMWIVEQGLCSCWASVRLSCLHAASEILLLLPSSQEILIDYCRTSWPVVSSSHAAALRTAANVGSATL